MRSDNVGRIYLDGETIVLQGESGNCMFVVQEGRVEVVCTEGGSTTRMAILGEGEFFGEMALFDRETRSATVRALGDVRVLTVDRRTLLRRVQEDPSLAFGIVQGMSARIRKLDSELTRLKTSDPPHEAS
jgi:CRP/FNR family cyclic AMP-dependent transcriptional regulator